MPQFIYFLTNPGNESFLKAEILKKYPQQLNFSYSKPGLVTYKNIGNELSPLELRPIYARAWGISLGVMDSEDAAGHTKNFAAEEIIQLPLDPENFEPKKINTAQIKIIQIQVDENKTFLGEYFRDHFQSPPGRLFYNTLSTTAPSRAYHKTKEAFELLGIKKTPLKCVEFGCAPGGGSQYLLECGHEVFGVDPADIAPEILQHKNFHFFKRPMQDFKRRDFPKQIDMLLSDVNLNPDVVLKQCHGIFKHSPPPIALITLKTPKPKYLDSLKKWKDFLHNMGYQNIDLVQLSSHRKECLAIARIV